MNAIEINTQMSVFVKADRKITLEILELINLSVTRKAYLELGFSSLFDWLVTGHGYSESAAQRRIQAAKLLRSTPEVAEKIESGSVNLTTLARAQTFLQTHEKISGDVITKEDRSKLVEKIENQTSREAEKSLSFLLPEVAQNLEIGKSTGLNTIKLSGEVFADLERAKEILSHIFPDGNLSEVLGCVLKDFLKRKDPLLKPVKSTAATTKRRVEVVKTDEVPTEQNKSSPEAAIFSAVDARISMATRRFVLQKAQGRCEFIDPLTKRKCGTRFQIQVDHIEPRALGGSNASENLRALCGKHNRLRAEKTFGEWSGKRTARKLF